MIEGVRHYSTGPQIPFRHRMQTPSGEYTHLPASPEPTSPLPRSHKFLRAGFAVLTAVGGAVGAALAVGHATAHNAQAAGPELNPMNACFDFAAINASSNADGVVYQTAPNPNCRPVEVVTYPNSRTVRVYGGDGWKQSTTFAASGCKGVLYGQHCSQRTWNIPVRIGGCDMSCTTDLSKARTGGGGKDPMPLTPGNEDYPIVITTSASCVLVTPQY